MKKLSRELLVPGIFAAIALVLVVGVDAQTPLPAGTPPVATNATPMSGHDMDSTEETAQPVDTKTECQAMMAKKQAMQDKLKEMDDTLDKLVAEMNAAKDSKAADAMEQPMAAVINELVAQRKARRSMMMKMQSEMMAHMMRHMMSAKSEGAMGCPMMQKDAADASKTEETKCNK